MATVRAVWNGQVIAESDKTVVVEGNQYFPPEAVRQEFLAASKTTSMCSWKGLASYYSLSVGGETNRDAAWYYPQPTDEAAEIRDYVAFWHGVKIETVR